MTLLALQAIKISPLLIIFPGLTILALGFLLFAIGYQKAHQGQALVRTGLGRPVVSFNGLFALPPFHKVEKVDITLKKLMVNSFGKKDFLTLDGKFLELHADFNLRVNPVSFDVLEAVMSFGAGNTFDLKFLRDLFLPKFKEAIRNVSARFTHSRIYENMAEFKRDIFKELGRDFNGYILEDFALEVRFPVHS